MTQIKNLFYKKGKLNYKIEMKENKNLYKILIKKIKNKNKN